MIMFKHKILYGDSNMKVCIRLMKRSGTEKNIPLLKQCHISSEFVPHLDLSTHNGI